MKTGQGQILPGYYKNGLGNVYLWVVEFWGRLVENEWIGEAFSDWDWDTRRDV